MAAIIPLSNQFSLYTPPRLSITTSPQQSGTKILAFQSHPYKPLLGLSKSFQKSSRPSFKSFSTPKDTTTLQTSEDEVESDDVEEAESDADQEIALSVKSLLQLYKEAILNKDGTTTSDIEAALCDVENEKNKLLERVEALTTEASSGKERYIRLQADFENFRKRSEKERLTVRSNAQGEVIESLLPMVDNFERAKQQLKLETDQEKKIDSSYQGIYKQFVEIMRSLRVAAVPTVGKPFDPSVHEAIAREESKEFNEGTVIEEFRRGFILGERLLRPAMVKVSAGPGPGPKSSAKTTPQEEQPQTADLRQR